MWRWLTSMISLLWPSVPGQNEVKPVPTPLQPTTRLWPTYYYTPSEADYDGPQDSPICAADGSVIALARRDFAKEIFIEGAGILADGRLVNTASGHKAIDGAPENRPANAYGDFFSVGKPPGRVYSGYRSYRLADAGVKWGYGTQGRVLVPLRTIAVVPGAIPYGSSVYIKQFDGLEIPGIMTPAGLVGGYVHDGFFTAGDTGGFAVDQPATDTTPFIPADPAHIDIFAGPTSMSRVLDKLIPTRSRLDAMIIPSGGGEGHPLVASTGAKVGKAGALFALVAGAAILAWKKTKG